MPDRAAAVRVRTISNPAPAMPSRHRARTATRAWGGRLLLTLCLLAPPLAAGEFDPATRQILIDGVTSATAMDIYYARCRGDISGRQTDNLNKLLVGKLRTTVLSVEDDLFPERDYRRARQRLEQDFLATLRDAGGCPGAKTSGLPERLRASYDSALDAIRALP